LYGKKSVAVALANPLLSGRPGAISTIKVYMGIPEYGTYFAALPVGWCFFEHFVLAAQK